MSELEPGAVYRALQEVAEGADPAEVYGALLTDTGFPEEELTEDMLAAEEAAHSFDECRNKYQSIGFCMGTTCRHLPGMILTVDCPCTCHEGEE
jgi:hypothetical protein